MKKTFYTEAAYFIGMPVLALGTAMMEYADFGLSMVVAPAYLVYLKLSAVYPFLTFGMAEYLFQALLLVVLFLVMGRFQVRYLFAFVSTLFYGACLDGWMLLTGCLPQGVLALRILFYILGLLICAGGVSLLFHTYLPPEVYELFVKEISDKYGFVTHRCKTCYDCISCLVAIGMSFLFFGFGHFEGVKLGTVFCALVNGWLIGRCSALLDARFAFVDRFRPQPKGEEGI